ncbi:MULTISPECIES: hypothetical protein [unclassified Bosea (in: a-proteobacteria)]|uniref:hypothetical protein n=1 Tax=unclassified Bosea (in: a-proteobacteria) TaxID=2653178 RepID=UPI000F7623C7|nr:MULTISPECIES: hypothetical protein [unclassified Bosea (in: a-proteobacteria)]AZO81960.1 hypothetical protein BLM15_29600 [Bosea sp. Tri-49]RXT16725.1 hypothetical protein B5U98_27810 [Bosea sp. Tri-39]RXT42354.1 hypothetical protein B5U99_00110 [Bosea sp. Tri-54]
MTDTLAIGRLSLRQRQLVAGEILVGPYDLVIVAVSWEARNATALQAIGGTTIETLMIRFESPKPTVDAKKDASQAALEALCPNNKILRLSRSIAFDKNSTDLENELRDRFLAKGRPLRILVDISCMPRSYLSFLCGLGFANDYICRFDCLYSEGQYDMRGSPSPGGPLSIISEGEWTSLQIPYLEASETFPVERDLIVILGGEIGYSLPFIERYEPNRLSIVFIRDGLDPEALTGSERAAYSELTSEPNLMREDFAINDMIGVVAHVWRFCTTDCGRPVIGLAIGSKAQSLALALAALDLDNLEVVCRIPSAYSDRDVEPSGRIFFYGIEDRFEPMSYLPEEPAKLAKA